LTIHTHAPTEQLLVVAESFHTGWKAKLLPSPVPGEGRGARVLRVNGDYLGCVVPPGDQTVTFEFQPSSLLTGRLVSYLGLAFLPFSFVGLLMKNSNPVVSSACK
jgi:uncharacterized membrane protein YfhO